jgi:hypothetical protein
LSVVAWWRLTDDQAGVRNRIAAVVWIVAGREKRGERDRERERDRKRRD